MLGVATKANLIPLCRCHLSSLGSSLLFSVPVKPDFVDTSVCFLFWYHVAVWYDCVSDETQSNGSRALNFGSKLNNTPLLTDGALTCTKNRRRSNCTTPYRSKPQRQKNISEIILLLWYTEGMRLAESQSYECTRASFVCSCFWESTRRWPRFQNLCQRDAA